MYLYFNRSYTLNVATLVIWSTAHLRSDGKVLGSPSRWSFQSMHQRSRWGEGTQIFAEGRWFFCLEKLREGELERPNSGVGGVKFQHLRTDDLFWAVKGVHVLPWMSCWQCDVHRWSVPETATVSPWLWGQSLLHWRTWHLGLNVVGMGMDQIPITFWSCQFAV